MICHGGVLGGGCLPNIQCAKKIVIGAQLVLQYRDHSSPGILSKIVSPIFLSPLGNPVPRFPSSPNSHDKSMHKHHHLEAKRSKLLRANALGHRSSFPLPQSSYAGARGNRRSPGPRFLGLIRPRRHGSGVRGSQGGGNLLSLLLSP